MSTWQQGINSGSFLAGIGQNNQNAPQASDANTALGFIRQNNENEWSGRNNVGLQALQGIAGNVGLYRQATQLQRQGEFQKAYGDAYATGDRNAMRQLASQYPEQIESVRNGMKFVDDDQRATVGSLAAGARLASSSPDAMANWLRENSSDLERVGLSARDVAQIYQQNPQQFSEFVDHLGMAALGPTDYYNVQDKIAGNAIKIRGQDFQSDIGQQRINIDRDANRINYENKLLDRQLQKETNDLKKQEIQQKIDANNQQLEQKRNDVNSGYIDGINTLTTSMGTLNDVLSGNVAGITGKRGMLPNVPGSDAANTQARLDTFKSQAYLSAVQVMKGMGALSDAEGKKLDAAVGSLQNSQSEESFRKNGKVIMDMYNQKRNDAVNKYVQLNRIKRVEAPQESIEYLREHPELSSYFINRYGYLPPIGE